MAFVSHFSDRVSEYLCFGCKPNFSPRGFIRWLLSMWNRYVMFKQWRIHANILLRNVSSLVCGFMQKNELAKRTKKSLKTSSFFVSIKQLPVKPISKKSQPHNVRQLAVVVLKRKSFNYSNGFCWTTEERDHPYLQNDHSRNVQAGKQTDMGEHSTVRRNDSARTETLVV